MFETLIRPVAFTAVIVLVVIGLAGCGESSEEKATAQVCSSTKAIQAQISKLSGLTLSTKAGKKSKLRLCDGTGSGEDQRISAQPARLEQVRRGIRAE